MILAIIITVWLLTISTLFLGGVVVIYFKAPQALKEAVNKITPRKKASIGIVNRPSARTVNNPNAILAEGEEEFIKSLKQAGIKPKKDENI